MRTGDSLQSQSQNQFCGRTRREFLWEMGAGFAGVALTSILEGVAQTGTEFLSKDRVLESRCEALEERIAEFARDWESGRFAE